MNDIVKHEAPIEIDDENENNETQTDNKSTALADSGIHLSATTKSIDPFLCHVCSKSFKHKHHLVIHLKVHSEEKEFACEICARKFRQKSHVNQHKKIHSGKKEFECEFCTKSFTHRGDLKRHLKTHRAQLPFRCSFCENRFGDIAEQQTHENVCLRRRFKCSICDFEAPDNAVLQDHQTKHIGERRFICDNCPKAFKLRQHLVVHLKTHAKAREEKRFGILIL